MVLTGRCSLLIASLLIAGCGKVAGDADDDGDDGAIDAGDQVDAGGDTGDADPPDPGSPNVISMNPDWGSTAGATRVEINGSGFATPGLIVTFNGELADVMVDSDTRMFAITPAGPHQPVVVEVQNDVGSIVGGEFRYLAPLYAADGKAGNPGNLYRIDPADGASTTVGPIALGVTGLEISPAGVLYAATNGVTGPQLATMDPYSGALDDILPLEAAGVASGARDITFVGDRLLGWKAQMLEIDIPTAEVTPIGATNGVSIATTLDGAVLLAATADAALSTVNTANGSTVAGPTMNGPAMTSVNAMTVVGTTLVGNFSTSTPTNASTLYAIDPATGACTPRGSLPVGIDALAGIPAQPGEPVAAAELPAPPPARLAPSAPVCAERLALRTTAGRRGMATAELLALSGRDIDDGWRRRVVPLASLKRLAPRATSVELTTCSGERALLALDSPGLALTANQRGQLKLVDLRAGFKARLSGVTDLRLR